MIATIESIVYPFVVKFNEYLSNYIWVFLLVGVGIFVAVCLCFFAFSSILCWNFFGKINAAYLFRKKNTKKPCLFIHSFLSFSLCWARSCPVILFGK